MPTYVALLRAVNLGGYGKLSMADFRTLLEGLGFKHVETYIQSGNAVFDAPGGPAKAGAAIAAGLEKLMGAPVGVMIRTHQDLSRIIAGNPYAAEAAADGARVHVAFLAVPAGAGAAAAMNEIVKKYPARRDRFHLAGDHVYLHLPDGAAETKFSGKTLDKATGVPGTGRNWNTVLKLHEMSKRQGPRDQGTTKAMV
jgi:uncharacterized protein (DUF1697 family)